MKFNIILIFYFSTHNIACLCNNVDLVVLVLSIYYCVLNNASIKKYHIHQNYHGMTKL